MPRDTLIDFISGQEIPATSEEIEATQPFSHILVEDYGYAKDTIITRPQYRVRRSPSDKKGYPVDIAVFEHKNDTHPKIIVECKAHHVKLTETKQLELYLSMSDAELGVMYNGSDSIYLRRIKTNNGDTFERINAIPKFGEKYEEIGLYKKANLKPTHNLKNIFNEIRGWIVANGNITRDEDIAMQIILLILCKIFDERFTEIDDNVKFRATNADSDEEIYNRIHELFKATKAKYNDVITDQDNIAFDGKTLRGIIGRLQRFSIIGTDRDSIADAFEVFMMKSVKASEGQFFTPRNVIKTIITAIQLGIDDVIIDSACGSGGFLVESLKHIEMLIDAKGNKCGWSDAAKNEEVKSLAIKNIRGLEKDPFLTKLSKSYMAILGDGKGGIFREDSLEIPSHWNVITQQYIKLDNFDILLANPPFGKNIKVEGEEKLKQYTLAYKNNSKGKASLQETGNVTTLFLERNMQLIKNSGKMGIILPEPYFALPKYKAAIDFMITGNNIEWIIDLPHNTFRPHNNAKCCAIIIQKGVPQQPFINMAVAEYIGHDHQGRILLDINGNVRDDTPQIIQEILERQSNNGELKNHYERQLTFRVKAEKVITNKILVPRFYWQEKLDLLEADAKQNDIELISLDVLLQKKIIKFFQGHGSPSGETKGLGDIPYIRVKDIVNWQVYTDITALIPQSEYDRIFKPTKALHPKDILYVSRGSYRIGSVAMVSPYDGDMLLTREIVVIRLIKNDNEYGITPEYLLYALSHKYVWEQTKNRIFYEPCLPNIADRWKEIKIPVLKDKQKFAILKERLSTTIEKQWEFKKNIADLRRLDNAYLI